MLKLFVFISGILITGAFSYKVVMNSEYIVYSSPADYSVSPTIAQAQVAGAEITVEEAHAAPLPIDTEVTIAQARVIEVHSIDTIQVEIDSRSIDVQLIGVDPPADEQLRNYFNHNEKKVLDTIKTLLENTTVYLVTEDEHDGIELEPWERYVFMKNMTLINTDLIANGLALHDTERDIPYAADFAQAMETAKQEQRGIWFTPTATPTAPPSKTPAHITQKKTTATQTKPSDIPTLQPSPLPTKTPTLPPRPTATPTPTSQPSNLPTLQQTTQSSPPNSLSADKLLTLINDHRTSKNLPALEQHEYLCNVANTRAPQLYDEIFVTKNVHAGFYAMNLPYWITENMAHYDSEEIIMKWWLNSSIHRNAIEGEHKYTCGACHGKSCVQLFTSFVKK